MRAATFRLHLFSILYWSQASLVQLSVGFSSLHPQLPHTCTHTYTFIRLSLFSLALSLLPPFAQTQHGKHERKTRSFYG
jgi:hypothetical protein